MKVLVTGVAGFIGFHVAAELIRQGFEVLGIDNLSSYYDLELKYSRLRELGVEIPPTGELAASTVYPKLTFLKGDIEDRSFVDRAFGYGPRAVCHLAAQPGVRYSLTHPDVYITTNVHGTLNLFESAKKNKVDHMLYASSSSVYGIESKMPFSERASADHPASLYAASKRASELLAHSYSHLHRIPTTGLRFFTVYGPWGRPDMAPFLFTRAILAGEPIELFNAGDMERDFTYVDDIVAGIVHLIDQPPQPNPEWDGKESASSSAPYRLYNIGNGKPVHLMEFVKQLERAIGKDAKIVNRPMQPGDVKATWADCSALQSTTGYSPSTDVATGIERFVSWYRSYYNV